jgi:hypothetical protein
MTAKTPIYLDYSATTPIDPRVAEKMIPYITEHFGNPASRSHPFGWTAEEAVEEARDEVAKLVNADPREIVWTSGATESNNLAIKGAANFYSGTKGKHIITASNVYIHVVFSDGDVVKIIADFIFVDVELCHVMLLFCCGVPQRDHLNKLLHHLCSMQPIQALL